MEVRATIVEQAQFEIFSVDMEKGDKAYWRLMSLDEFDGELWKASSNFEPADGPVESGLDKSVPTRLVRQTITTRNLGNIYLPVAFELAEVVAPVRLKTRWPGSTANWLGSRSKP